MAISRKVMFIAKEIELGQIQDKNIKNFSRRNWTKLVVTHWPAP